MSRSSHLIHASKVNPESFAPFGTIIQNPSSHGGSPRTLQSIEANQGSATKWLDVTDMRNFYDRSASRKPARVTMNLFVCRPRELRREKVSGQIRERALFDVKVLERHPFTPQTFIPIGLGAEDENTRYLVIVAPTLPLRARNKDETSTPPYPTPVPRRRKSLKERLLGARPNPFTNDFEARTTSKRPGKVPDGQKMKGPGAPDLANLKAFLVRGDQAVTYGPGTWHAPMVVLGDKPIDFVVVQYANGVGVEDCQEVDIIAKEATQAICVEVCESEEDESILKAKL